jgi:hypothetical protein
VSNNYLPRLLDALQARHSISSETLTSISKRCIESYDPVAFLTAFKQAIQACSISYSEFEMFDNFLMMYCINHNYRYFSRGDVTENIDLAKKFFNSGLVSGDIDSELLILYIKKTNTTPYDVLSNERIHKNIKRQIMALL